LKYITPLVLSSSYWYITFSSIWSSPRGIYWWKLLVVEAMLVIGFLPKWLALSKGTSWSGTVVGRSLAPGSIIYFLFWGAGRFSFESPLLGVRGCVWGFIGVFDGLISSPLEIGRTFW
jgi:hypothetical protein